MTDGFKTVTFRVDPPTRTSVTDTPCVLHVGDDSLIFVFSNVYGIDPASCVAGLLDPEVPGHNLATFLSFAFVPGDTSSVYCRVSLATVELAASLDGGTVDSVTLSGVGIGEAKTLRLYLMDGTRTWLDMDVPVYREPLSSASGATASSAWVTKAALAAVATHIKTMPTLTAAQREARFQYLVDGLEDLISP